ncbi:uncharacterized protein Z518_05954 [Rhinocladiella mackenziei CBS 650.93]|uniref:J domain-containing protein n=1 Tax=Rhinocladiella mackenziei CBS 650.93 TaxID=1442369 RepID=A0A0D2FSI7_9EURO|nr:uncharacterized protein Z518_05954 [Rhinocladiella mackenziei CBS 650.93]KIX05082.1 hypothetical protein Z518_05954 [Rhinocladiella mackenziei CBS 650.93]
MIFRPASISATLYLSSLRVTTSSPNPAIRCLIYRSSERHFSQTSAAFSRRDSRQTHYDILKIAPHATQAELKKQFYVLSKETHPDINPNNPDAGKRFAQISESYSVLADPEKRKRYDRDVMRSHQAHRHGHGGHMHGSHSSHQHRGGTYAGSRPASGLSKRRSAFKGPPPSFYAHGKPTANTMNQARGGQGGARPHPHMAGTFNTGAYTEEGKFDPAFDPRSTYKTQTHEDYRRASRRAGELAAAQAEMEMDDNFWGRFVLVSVILVLSLSLGSLIVSVANTPRGGLTRGDGSRRDAARNDWTKG